MINSIHPAWQFILALKSKGMDPRDKGLPLQGGCESANETSKLLSDVLEALNRDGNVNRLFRRKKHGQKYSDLYEAYKIFCLNDYRLYIETSLMKGRDKLEPVEAEITSELGINPMVLGAYKTAFFDVTVFDSEIDVLEYQESISDSREKLLRKAWLRDRDLLKYHLGIKSNMDPKVIMESLLMDAYGRYMDSRGTGASQKWCELAIKLASRLIDEIDAANFMEDITLALELTQPEFEAFSDAAGLKEIKKTLSSGK
jgi:hypothetical protein